MKILTTSDRFLLTAIVLTLVTATGDARSARADHRDDHRVGLGGYCPVCILDAKKWERGSSAHRVNYDRVEYQFPNEAIQQTFLADPAKYVPALGGDCVVCYAKLGKRVPGNIHHTAIHQGRLFLFPNDQEKQAFLDNPREFADVDLALDGECSVCLTKLGKHVPGKPEYTAIHNGLRYQFPSDRERQAFLKNPAEFARVAKTQAMQTRLFPMTDNAQTLSATGRTGCAGCEHGVTPLGAPDELGLAVNTSDGQVIVVEGAHENYPKLYEGRFSGTRVKVTGKVLKRDGKITWLRPETLVAL